jgi:NAD(P)-dependent dehydrogenase (short-subunit alcohol dehydrogenase family)
VPWYPLQGKVAVVTGAGKGIGAATATALSAAGGAVTVAARTTAELEAVARGIHHRGGSALVTRTDVTDDRQVEAMIERTVDAFGRIDFLINCAAVTQPVGQPAWTIETSAWRRSIETNLVGAFLVSHAAVPHMLRQGSGRLVMVSSVFGDLVVPHTSAYASARAGLNHFIRVLAAELQGSGVTANFAYPGVVDTGGLRQFRASLQRMPLTSVMDTQARDPAEAAQFLLWLCSLATAGITGSVLSIDDPWVKRRMARWSSYRQSAWEPPE